MILSWIHKLILRREPPNHLNQSLPVVAWKMVRKFISAVVAPALPFNFLRIWLYRFVGFKIGRECFIGMRCYLDDVDPRCTVIGDYVTISYCCKFAVHGQTQGHTHIHIRDHVYIGLGCILIGGKDGITIEQGAIIGAGTLVNRSVPDHKVAAGVPIRILRDVAPSSRELAVLASRADPTAEAKRDCEHPAPANETTAQSDGPN